MKLFVIMSNDFPAGVMDCTEAEALAYCEKRNADDKVSANKEFRSRIYWTCFGFELGVIAR